MINSFHTEIAKEVGVNAAVIFYNISYWIEKNATNGKNMFDGNCWTYNSISAFEKQFEFLTSNQVRTALEKLIKNELIIVGNFNNAKYDRTKWYAINPIAFGKYQISICQKIEIHLGKNTNGFEENHEPIPDSKQLIENTNRKTNVLPEKEKSSFSEKYADGNMTKYFLAGIELSWQGWLIYKRQEFGFNFKCEASYKSGLKKLWKLSNGDIFKAKEIISQSIESGYRGLFEIRHKKNNNSGATKSGMVY